MRLMLPSVETLNSIDITTNSLQEAFGQPNGIPHNTNQPWCTTNVVKDVHEERKVQPTLEKLKGNLILNHRKPPDSTIVPPNNPYDVSTNDFTERTTRDNMSMPTTSSSTRKNSKKSTDLQNKFCEMNQTTILLNSCTNNLPRTSQRTSMNSSTSEI